MVGFADICDHPEKWEWEQCFQERHCGTATWADSFGDAVLVNDKARRDGREQKYFWLVQMNSG